jgi:hypothetical protein
MKNFWVSWYSPSKLGSWEMFNPWWISGYAVGGDEDVPTICSAVRAESEDDAKMGLMLRYDTPPNPDDIAWRFAEERPDNWSPFTDRFERAAWMVWPATLPTSVPANGG